MHPRRHLLMQVDPLRVWRVDGAWVRDRLDIEFTNGAHPLVAPYVPAGEIWIDREGAGAGREWRFWALYQLAHWRRMSRGASYLEALASAERVERRARRDELVRGPLRELAVRRRLGTARGRAVYLVRGRVVRDLAFVHFTMGGHHERYRFIPPGEIWIDDAVAPAERAPTLHHELVELELMEEQGMKYAEAHARASAAERAFRQRRGRSSSGVLGSRYLASLAVR